MPITFRTLAFGTSALAAAIAPASQVIFDSKGFETPPYNVGILTGQQNWISAVGTNTSLVRNGIGVGGTNAATLEAGRNTAGWSAWYYPSGLSVKPADWNSIDIIWDQQVTIPAATRSTAFGVTVYDERFYEIAGVMLYNDLTNSTIGMNVFDGFVPGGSYGYYLAGKTLNRGEYHQYGMRIDLQSQTYRVYLDGAEVDTGFTLDLFLLAPGGGLVQFDFAMFGAGQDRSFYDNFRVLGYSAAGTGILSGEVSLSDFTGNAVGEPITVSLFAPGTTTPTATFNTTLGLAGRWQVSTGLTGNFDVIVKPRTWLAETFGTRALGATPINSLDQAYRNGDVDGDDGVTVFDYDALSRAFDSTPVDASWNRDADLDGDLAVTVFDYDILSKNFDQNGALP